MVGHGGREASSTSPIRGLISGMFPGDVGQNNRRANVIRDTHSCSEPGPRHQACTQALPNVYGHITLKIPVLV